MVTDFSFESILCHPLDFLKFRPDHRADLLDKFVYSVPVCCVDPFLPSRPQQQTNHHRVVDTVEQRLTDVEYPQPPQEIKLSLSLSVHCFHVALPVQLNVQLHIKVSVAEHDNNGGYRCWLGPPPTSPEVYNQLIGFCDVKMEMTELTPSQDSSFLKY